MEPEARESSGLKPRLLMLPLEIRHIIYHLLQTNSGSHWHVGKAHQRPKATGTHLFQYGIRYPRKNLTLFGLRATNRQLHQETHEFITYPNLCLRLVDTMSFKNWSSPEVQTLIGDSFARENIVAVQFHFAFNGKCLYRSKSRVKVDADQQDHVPFTIVKTTLKSLFSLFGKHNTAQKMPFSLKGFLEYMESCPRLSLVTIINDHTDFYDLWEDPVGDLEAFEPLLKRGVHIEIQQYPSCSPKMEVYKKFEQMLKRLSVDEVTTSGRIGLKRCGGSSSAAVKIRPMSQAEWFKRYEGCYLNRIN
jgi:hypothetical protein